MAIYTLAPVPKQTFLDDDGLLVPGGLLWTYESGTSTPAPTYTTPDGTAHENPIELDLAGRPPNEIYLPPGTTQKWVFERPATPPAHGAVIWTAPTVAAVPLSASNQDVVGVAGETLTAGQVVYLSSGAAGLIAGQWYKADARYAYASTLPTVGMVIANIATGDEGTIRQGGQFDSAISLTIGSSYYVAEEAGALTATAPTNARLMGVADTTTSIILAPDRLQTWDVLGTAGTTITAGQSVYMSDGSNGGTPGRWYLTDSDFEFSCTTPLVGISLQGLTIGLVGTMRLGGRVVGTGFTAGSSYYVSATDGVLTSTAPTFRRFVGVADSTTSIVIAPNPAQHAVAKPFMQWLPQSNQPPATAYATLDLRNSHPVLDFDGSTDEEAVFGAVMPPSYGGRGVTVVVVFACTSATSGTVRWQAAIEPMSGDLDSDAFAAFQSAGATAPGTAGQATIVSIVFTDGSQMGSITGLSSFRLKIRRDADGTSGTDDVATDVELYRVLMYET